MFQRLRCRTSSESGVAIVAAVAVAFVVMAMLVIIMSLTIATLNNSGRDRVRTAEIHSAEGAIDATMAELEDAVICGAPDWSGMTVGSGTQATVIDVEITYYADDFATEINCTGGSMASDPTYAIVRATSSSAEDLNGINPVRVIEARLQVTPRGGAISLPGIYSARNMYMVGTPDVFSEEDDGSPDIWVDTGNFYCRPTTNRQLEIEAAVVVGQGNAELQEWCWFDREVFVGGNTTWRNSSASNGSQLDSPPCNNKFFCGDFTTRGNLSVAWNAERMTVAGDVTVGGNISGSNIRVDGATSTGVSDIEEMPVRGFPDIEYVAANWTNAYGMVEVGVDEFIDALDFKSGWVRRYGQWYYVEYDEDDVAGCDFDPTYYDSTIRLPAEPRVYDLREISSGCDVVEFSSTQTIEINADTAFFVSGFFNDGTLQFVSGDGEEHSVWFIVPDDLPDMTSYNGSTSCSSPTEFNLCTTHILTTSPDIAVMWYTSHLFRSDGASPSVNDMYGQVFAGSVVFTGYLDLQFETLTVPGEILWEAGEAGFDVQLLSKSESSNS